MFGQSQSYAVVRAEQIMTIYMPSTLSLSCANAVNHHAEAVRAYSLGGGQLLRLQSSVLWPGSCLISNSVQEHSLQDRSQRKCRRCQPPAEAPPLHPCGNSMGTHQPI